MNIQSVGNIVNSDVSDVNMFNSSKPREEHYKSHKVSPIHYILLSVELLLLSVSLCVLFIVLPRNEQLSFDYIGVMVTVLSIIVMILISWNVYSIIDLKRQSSLYSLKIAELAQLTDRVHMINIDNQMTNENAIFYIYHYLILNKSPNGLIYNFLWHGISTIQYASQNSRFDMCELLVKAMNEVFVDTSKIEMVSINKRRLIELYDSIPNKNNIENINSILEKLALIKTK